MMRMTIITKAMPATLPTLPKNRYSKMMLKSVTCLIYHPSLVYVTNSNGIGNSFTFNYKCTSYGMLFFASVINNCQTNSLHVV